MSTELSLFRRQPGTVRGVIAPATVLDMIGRRREEIAETNPAFAGTRFTLHDFRRLFAEDVVKHCQEFLDHRRALRPEGEYTDVTPG
ncbi:hypothetical protein AB0A94_21230 [Streptomyces sp. NPDC044984]|uniref:hypothetical protein n=1 Tax=Streptomyces sp. NPDC044984 TaxID=3154335 RepID=UPI0033D72F23